MKRLAFVLVLLTAVPALGDAAKKADRDATPPHDTTTPPHDKKTPHDDQKTRHDKKSSHHNRKTARDVFPDIQHERVDYWVAEFSKDHDYHKKIAAGFERKTKYQEMLERKLRKRGMPQNLIYLAFEESAFDPVARSSQRAAGIWQLTPATAKLYGLKVGKKHDERLTVEEETDAALKFLDHLYDCFGSWYLAAAAYNAGPNKIKRIMKHKLKRTKGTDRDYYRIWDDLPPQTRDYVPAIVALKRIGKEPGKYGF